MVKVIKIGVFFLRALRRASSASLSLSSAFHPSRHVTNCTCNSADEPHNFAQPRMHARTRTMPVSRTRGRIADKAPGRCHVCRLANRRTCAVLSDGSDRDRRREPVSSRAYRRQASWQWPRFHVEREREREVHPLASDASLKVRSYRQFRAFPSALEKLEPAASADLDSIYVDHNPTRRFPSFLLTHGRCWISFAFGKLRFLPD